MNTLRNRQTANVQQQTNDQQQISDLLQQVDQWSIGVGSIFVLAFLVLLLISLANLPVNSILLRGIGLLLLIVALQIFLVHSRVRPNWLEIELLALVILGFAIWQLTSSSNASATSSKPFTYPTTETANASFSLPADKIQSDLTVLQPNSSVRLLFISDHAVQNYNVTLLDIKGVGSQDHKPPYNKDAVEVDVSLPQGVNGITAATFASQLQSVKSIYLFPSAPTPTPIIPLSNLTFALPMSKVGSDQNCLQSNLKVGDSVTVILVVNNQLLSYSAKVISVPTLVSTPTYGCPTPTKTTTPASTKGSASPMTTPTPTSAATIGIQLMTTSNDTVTDFANQLTNATTIYLLQ